MEYRIKRVEKRPDIAAEWNTGDWQHAQTLQITHFHPLSTVHRPYTQAKLLYCDEGIAVQYHVQDRYVRATYAKYQDPVCRDSCVEFFVQPREDAGYFNFEMNCIGTLHLSYIEDPERVGDGFRRWTRIPQDVGKLVEIRPSLKGLITREIADPLTWRIGAFIPFAVFESQIGPLDSLPGRQWRANLYKCGDDTSHPHWAAWSPIGANLNFHQPARFAPVVFEG